MDTHDHSFIARQSVLHPLPAAGDKVGALLDKLQAHYSILPGYVLGFRYRPTDDPEELGRIAVWRCLEDADHAAQDPHVIALRSQLKLLVREDSVERVLVVEGTPFFAPGI